MLRHLAASGRRAAVLRHLRPISQSGAGGNAVCALSETPCQASLQRQCLPVAQAGLQQCKRFSVDFPATLGIDPDKLDADGQPQEIDVDHFHRTADLTLGELLQKVDEHLQQQGAGSGMRVDMTEGKLQIRLGEGRALVLSKDPEARQLHASGAGGDASFALAEESSGVLQTSGTEGPRWAAVDGGEDLHEVVEAELEAATGQRIDLEPEPRSGYGPDPT